MSTSSITVCPHCGKELSSPDKLGWHLSRECPELANLTKAATTPKDEAPATHR